MKCEALPKRILLRASVIHMGLRAAVVSSLLSFSLAGCDNPVFGRLAQIVINPNPVVFLNATPQPTAYEEVILISNVGNADLNIMRMTIQGDEHFELAENTPASTVLGPQKDLEVIVRYNAVDLEHREALLTVFSNDPDHPFAAVAIQNDDVRPKMSVTDCVRGAAAVDGGAAGACQTPVDDFIVDFGELRPTQCRTAEVIVANTGTAELVVQAPVFQAGSSPDITFDGAAPGEIRLARATQAATATQVIKVKFCGMRAGSQEAELLLSSNDPVNSQVIVRLVGVVQDSVAPTCVCNPSTLEIAPQDTVNLTANCTDPDMQPLQYAWTVERRPAGSTEQIRNANSRNASFTANTATSANEPYVFRITATDTFGLSGSCTITVHAIPRDALHIQLVWDTDETDVDLHFLNPPGVASPFAAATGYFSSPNDNYFANRTPDWGIAANTQDNPRLDLDDTTGFGPENINLARPLSGQYEVGVHYYCDDSMGASRATVRIFCNGQLSNEFGPKNLPVTGFFWQVARVQWPGCTITEVDQTRTVTQGCLGFGF